MNEFEKRVIEILDDTQDEYANDDMFSIKSWGADLSFRELIQQYADEDLVKPEIQRNYVWDRGEASRFIDSVLMGLPVPSIFLAKTVDEKMLIIDGFQRIMTIYDFVHRGIFGGDGSVFSLSNSTKINPRWAGRTFQQLSEIEQRKLRNTTIHCIIFEQTSPRDGDTSYNQIFERINTSGRTLNAQEIRNCVSFGELNRSFIEANTDSNWRTLLGISRPDARMRDIEFMLRFYALDSRYWDKDTMSSISLKKYLNEFMASHRSETLSNCAVFLDLVEKWNSVSGGNAFHNISKKDATKFVEKFNPVLFDALMIAAAIAGRHGISFPENFEERRVALLLDDEFQDLLRYRTTTISRIHGRIFLAGKHIFGFEYDKSLC